MHVVATTQVIDPAGQSADFDGRPTDLALSPDEKTLAVKNMKNILFLDVSGVEILQVLDFPAGGSTFTGIAWSGDGTKVWVTDSKGYLRSAVRDSLGVYNWKDTFMMPSPAAGDTKGAYPCGFMLDDERDVMYVALSRNNSVAVVDAMTGSVQKQIPVGMAPYDIVRAGTKAYVTNLGGRRVKDGDTTGPSSGSRVVVDPNTGIASSGTVSVLDLGRMEVIAEIDVQLQPTGMAVAPDGALLYVANANSDRISVIDTRLDSVVETLDPRPMENLPLGSAPNALTVSPDGRTLYVANGGNNAIAVIDLDDGIVTGLIPTGWYPGSVVLSADGGKMYVANVKGIGSSRAGSEQVRKKIFDYSGIAYSEVVARGYNSHEHRGSVSFIPVPDRATLQQYTARTATNLRLPEIYKNMRLEGVEERKVPVPMRPGEKSVFKHVLYIIKENRTYDQVFGDMPQGNGDPALCHFGREVTPNHHALAEQFVLLDNTYCNGVLSADGHQWTDEGMVTDYLEKGFGDFVRSYPYDGDDALAYASSGFIWDHVLNAGLTFRNYGEFVQAKIEPRTATWTDIYSDYLQGTDNVKIRATTDLHTLEPYLCPTYVGFPGSVPDVYRAREFISEFEQFEENDNLPNFMIMLLPNDHTVGTRPGFPTPRATVADNDLALGQIIEKVSNSRYWKETAIFVIQDDPQAGLDHVDGRRTVALCVSPYTKRGAVVSAHYNQNSVLRTIELIFGLAPMTLFDMTANPMYECFTETPDFTPYNCLPNRIPLDEMNPALSEIVHEKQRFYAQKSIEMPLDDIDQADEGLFNLILWHSVKGYDVPYPVLARDKKDEEAEDIFN
jgi:YVTN family beta-propeller protein